MLAALATCEGTPPAGRSVMLYKLDTAGNVALLLGSTLGVVFSLWIGLCVSTPTARCTQFRRLYKAFALGYQPIFAFEAIIGIAAYGEHYVPPSSHSIPGHRPNEPPTPTPNVRPNPRPP